VSSLLLLIYCEEQRPEGGTLLFGCLRVEYRKLWTANTISNLGDGVTLVAGPLLAASLTRDPILVAGVAFAQRVPWLLFPLISGALVDRLDRRRVMGYVDAARTALIGALGVAVLLGWASLPLIYVIFFLMGTLETLFDNASQAIIPALVSRERLERANSRLYAAEIVSNQLAGPPLGGLLFGLAVAVPFLLDAGTFAATAALILALRGQFRPERPEGAPPTTLATEIGEGLRWLWNHRLIRSLAIMLGVFNMTFAATDAIFVLFAQDILGLGSFGYGVMLTSGAVGGLIGSLAADKIVAWFGSGRALQASVLISALVLTVVAFSESAFVVWAVFLLVGITVVVWNVITVSFRQAVVPEEIFGRVNSVYRLLGWGGISVGALLGGFLARNFGLTAPFWFAAIVLAMMFIITLPFVNNRTMGEARESREGS
jgi:MFS family permease